MPSNKNIIIISNEPWGDVWYSKHNYAYELSKKNKVIFLNPPKKWKLGNLFKKIEISAISDNLFQLTYTNILPSVNTIFFKLNNLLVSLKLKRFFKENNFADYICWTFDPYRLYSPQKLGASKSLFHIVDNYQFNHRGEKETCNNSDYFVCVSENIAKNYKSFNKRMLVIPHALSSDEFISTQRPTEIPEKQYALYIGNIDKRLDYDQIERIIIAFPTIEFVFIGKLHFAPNNIAADAIFNKKKYSNVKYLGIKNFKELKNYIKHAKFCFAWMDEKFHGNRIAHHKIFQYLAFGKPVFCSVFSDYIPIKSYLYMEDDTDNMIQIIDNYMKNGEDPHLVDQRINMAKEHTFEKALAKIDLFINE
ncbi:MAG: hypothetical protein J0L87_09655 [Bacteroidetes bacterium]|nr:hypothetical protein [Bacteroidota bacterium]